MSQQSRLSPISELSQPRLSQKQYSQTECSQSLSQMLSPTPPETTSQPLRSPTKRKMSVACTPIKIACSQHVVKETQESKESYHSIEDLPEKKTNKLHDKSPSKNPNKPCRMRS